jgi:alpha-tubulin suppressor-like RCC1 family protein
MANFSESNEYKGKQAAEVTVSVLHVFLLDRSPTKGEFATAVAAIEGGLSVADYAAGVLASTEFTHHVEATQPLTGATVISTGHNISCAVLAGGTAKCWGENTFGGLGDGTTTVRTTPVTVAGLVGATAISTDWVHTCALLADGTAKCWGYNAYGQLGNATTENSTTPVAVSGLTGATAIDVGTDFSCALLSGGTVRCWGRTWEDGEPAAWTTTPVAVPGLTGATTLSVSGKHACAKTSGGALKCWGDDAFGQSSGGRAKSTPRAYAATPVTIPGISAPKAATAGGTRGCAVLSGGTARCWGLNLNFQLGDGTDFWRTAPVTVSGVSGATAIAADGDTTCALLAGGAAKCWGPWNDLGQLGDGTTATRRLPVAVAGLTGATSISVGVTSTCAIVAGGAVKCWGANDHGQLGDGTKTDRTKPVTVLHG